VHTDLTTGGFGVRLIRSPRSHNSKDCSNPRNFTGECKSCGKEGHMLRDCPSKAPMRCYNCNQRGHQSGDCDKPPFCPRCRSDHNLRDCPLPKSCRQCGSDEHTFKTCPAKPAETCNNCGEEGKPGRGVGVLIHTDSPAIRPQSCRVQEPPQDRPRQRARRHPRGGPRGVAQGG